MAKQSVVHVLWERPAYKDSRDAFMVKLKRLGRREFEDFKTVSFVESFFCSKLYI